MLKQILDRLRDSNEPVNLADLCRELDVDQSALDGMLLQLVRQGKLREISTEAVTCGRCGGCAATCSASIEGKAFAVVKDH